MTCIVITEEYLKYLPTGWYTDKDGDSYHWTNPDQWIVGDHPNLRQKNNVLYSTPLGRTNEKS